MRWQRSAALRTVRQLAGLFRVVRTPLAGSRIGVFSLWDSHWTPRIPLLIPNPSDFLLEVSTAGMALQPNIPAKFLDGAGASLASSDPNAIVHWQDKYFSVTDLAFFSGSAALQDGVHGRFDKFIIYRNLKLDFSEQIHAHFATAKCFGLAFLPSEALAVHYR